MKEQIAKLIQTGKFKGYRLKNIIGHTSKLV